jgi:hypothetical protein
MAIDLETARCRVFSLHSHFPAGEPAKDLLVKACGSEFSKRRGRAEGRYSVSGRPYRVGVSVNRSATFGTVVDIEYGHVPRKPRKAKTILDVDKLWKCLGRASKLPKRWHCRAIFEFPPIGYNLKYGLPSPIARPMDGFNEIRGVRLARTIEGKVLYTVILDRPDNAEITCTLFFTIQDEKLEGLADDAFGKACDIIELVVSPEPKSGQ